MPPVASQPSMIADAPSDLGKRIPVDDKLWPAVLNELKKTHNTLYGIVRHSRPTFYQQGLELAFTFSFHKKRVSENKNKDIICGLMKDLTGQDIGLYCVLINKDAPEPGGIPDFDDVPADAPKIEVKEKPVDPNLAAVSNIFGGAEVLEK